MSEKFFLGRFRSCSLRLSFLLPLLHTVVVLYAVLRDGAKISYEASVG